MPEISAIMGIHQLARVEEFIDVRNKVADAYNEAFGRLDGFSIINYPKGHRCSYYKYPLVLSKSINKQNFTQTLKLHGVETGTVFYPPCHMQPVYNKRFLTQTELPVSETVLKRTITLPIHSALTDLEVLSVIENVEIATCL
jgi:dTDP-4-amino-4,6-dideoxygalactose transaminase